MNPQKNIYLFKNKILNHNKKLQDFKCFFSHFSNCHRKYGVFDDKENIN